MRCRIRSAILLSVSRKFRYVSMRNTNMLVDKDDAHVLALFGKPIKRGFDG